MRHLPEGFATLAYPVCRPPYTLTRIEDGIASGDCPANLARRLGMAAPSLYSYFASKDALHDAMFTQGNRELLAVQIGRGQDLREQLGLMARKFVRFCGEDPVRYQLLFQRTVPGCTPSEESRALAGPRGLRPLQDDPVAAGAAT